MKPKCIVLIIVVLLWMPFTGMTQSLELEWERQFGSSKMDMFIDVIEDINGGYTVLGATQLKSKNDQDFWIVRFNEKGDTLWIKVMGTQNFDYPSSLAQLPDGSYILTGKTEFEPDNYQAFIIKIDEQGSELWQRNIGDRHYKCAENVVATSEGEIIVSGIKITDSDIENIWIAKLDSDGNTLWEKLLEEGKMSCSKSLKSLPDGSFALAGSVSEKNIPDADLMLVRFTSQGEILWEHTEESVNKNVWPECICCSPDSNFIVVGWHGTCMNDIRSEYPVFDYDLFISKISQDGKLLWSKNIDSEGSEGGNAVVVRNDGKILLAGKKETSFLGKVGPWLLLSNENGEVIDELLLPFKFNRDQAVEIINSSDGGFVVIGPGEIDPDYGRSDGWIKKFKSF